MARRRHRKLRRGFTTGTAAAAATKAALILLLSGRPPQRVEVELLTGDGLEIEVHHCRRIDACTARCTVIKDAGDDPDITHGAEIGARVTWELGQGDRRVEIRGGSGVGRVTKPGLEVAPGGPAINPGPCRMIRRSAMEALAAYDGFGRVTTEIFVPRGVELARKTLNRRLGIVDGISILGTTGIVQPLSHEAYVATIRAGLSVARAAGLERAVLATGRRSERLAQELWPDLAAEGFMQIGDYFARSMEMAAEMGFAQVVLAIFFGKAVKMAQGIPHTHARSARLTLERLGRWALEVTGNRELARQVAGANTARHAFDLVGRDHPQLIAKVGREVVRAAAGFGKERVAVRAIIFGFDGKVRYDSDPGRK